MENDVKQYIEAHTEKLAAMVAEGFASTATKQEVGDLREKVSNLGQQVGGVRQEVSDLRTEMHTRFDKIEERLDRIEKSHTYRLETLERDVSVLKT